MNAELDAKKQTLESQQTTLSDLNKKIEDKKQEEQQAQTNAQSVNEKAQTFAEQDKQEMNKLFIESVSRLTLDRGRLSAPYSWTQETFCNQIKQSDPKVGFTIDQVDVNTNPKEQSVVQSVLGFAYMCKQSGQGSRLVSHKSDTDFYTECLVDKNNTFCDDASKAAPNDVPAAATPATNEQFMKRVSDIMKQGPNSAYTFSKDKFCKNAKAHRNEYVSAGFLIRDVDITVNPEDQALVQNVLGMVYVCKQLGQDIVAGPSADNTAFSAKCNIIDSDVCAEFEKPSKNLTKTDKQTKQEQVTEQPAKASDSGTEIKSDGANSSSATNIDWWCSSLSTASTTLSSQKEVVRKMGFVADGKNCFCSALMTSGVAFEHWTKQQEYTTKDECAQKCKGACGL